ncbi:DUF1634 domain-containing protein [Desulfosporosinus sp. PR]|uniref:DUF1634 domain-containing protein n=1 Tax=Candidatus Desulfosporosinus nitrosoreducens TaxID=3401928 RepID=UPI0027EAA72F|nr:DUF1634 domain-containing protein [Desulfosporosinus sp. PR]MDQ7092395.1 DUF1634 domain-containing protein [Desulfosporosinus sp. PR]
MNSQVSVSGSEPKSVVGPSNEAQSSSKVSPEQNRYASILLVCSWIGIVVMAITFVLYMAGMFNPVVAPSMMPQYWGLSVHEYAKITHAPSGWGWFAMINHADYMNLIGLAFLGLVSVLGYISLFVNYTAKKDFPYAIMVGLEIIIIVSAASGIFHVAG